MNNIDKGAIGGIVIGLLIVGYMIFYGHQTDAMMYQSDGGAAGKFDDSVNSKEVQEAIAEHDQKAIEDYWNNTNNS